MAIPWLIGAAVLGVGALIAASSNDDDSSSSSRDDSEERRRRESAERERVIRQQTEKADTIKKAFQQEGNQRSKDLKNLLLGWVNVDYSSHTPFSIVLTSAGSERRRSINDYFIDEYDIDRTLLDNTTLNNLKFFEESYDVDLSMGSQFQKAVDTLLDIKDQRSMLQTYKSELELVRKQLIQQSRKS